MNIVEASEDIYLWLHKKLDGITIPSDERTRASASCLDIAMEHQIAITILIKKNLIGSAFALSRSVFESYIRGLWLKVCATDKEVSDYLKGKTSGTFQDLIDGIEKIEGYSDGILSEAKKSSWKMLNDFTHTGAQQIIRRNTSSHIEPNYDESEINMIVGFVNSICLLSGLETAGLIKDVDNKLQLEVLNKIKEYEVHS
ncbi:MAG: hypothetical protein COA96_01335 [SAR86 cluster bacterium]|uniref:Uncharacterized protein n=1 Tax=SAR86 cluster bacterium TaxID=2030880 RepID=A0A2A5B9Y7_9GAMM|nr:MAG: hypothetical protein COA96_01335 [SAR86 cluster bacterium]